MQISQLLANQYGYEYGPEAQEEFNTFMNTRKEFPYFSNARTVRNAMERARRIAGNFKSQSKSKIDEGLRVYFSILVVSHLMWIGALDGSNFLQSRSILSLA